MGYLPFFEAHRDVEVQTVHHIPASWPGTGMTRKGDSDLIGTSSLTTAPV
jgi:hypothetical protein